MIFLLSFSLQTFDRYMELLLIRIVAVLPEIASAFVMAPITLNVTTPQGIKRISLTNM